MILVKTMITTCALHTPPIYGGARGVMVIVRENGHGDTSSHPGRG